MSILWNGLGVEDYWNQPLDDFENPISVFSFAQESIRDWKGRI